MTIEEKAYLSQVAQVGCIVCRQWLGEFDSPAEIHHMRTGMGTAQRNTNYNIIPLCAVHHRIGDGTTNFNGEVGYHFNPRLFEKLYGLETKLQEQTNNIINEGYAKSCWLKNLQEAY
jgi:hypothetical protein